MRVSVLIAWYQADSVTFQELDFVANSMDEQPKEPRPLIVLHPDPKLAVCREEAHHNFIVVIKSLLYLFSNPP